MKTSLQMNNNNSI